MSIVEPLTVGIWGPAQGWQCPLCKSVYSPDTPMCFQCPSETITSTSLEGTAWDEIQKELELTREQILKGKSDES